MPEPFQDFTHRGATYDRPNSKWICGGSCEGCACLLGPTTGGKCQAGAVFDGRVSGECLPSRQGPLWVCNRVDTHGGSPCEEGPLPDGSCCRQVPKCQPRPSLRRLRGQCVALACIATLGLLLCLLTSKPAADGGPPLALNPGPLSFAHASFENDCTKCHSAPELGPDRLATFNPHGFDRRTMEDGERCRVCHSEIGGNKGEFAFYPHSTSPATLPKPSTLIVPRNPGPVLVGASAIASGLKGDHISCATCHVEHRGENFDLTSFSDEQCQVCHQSQFKSFAQLHPEFDRMHYPHNRRTRIFFDHYSHYQKHFPEKAETNPDDVPKDFVAASGHTESKSCTTCHSPATDSGQMKVNGFEESCAKCHTKSVFSTEAFPVLAIPKVDIDSINDHVEFLGTKGTEKREQDAGTWFKDYEIQEGFPWPMLLFLDQDTRAKWNQLVKAGIDIGNLREPRKASREQLQLATDVFFGFKQLLVDVSEGSAEGKRGSAELARRLRENGFSEPSAMLHGLPQDAFLRFRGNLSPSETDFLASSPSAAKLARLQEKLKAVAEAADDDAKARLARDLAVPFEWRELVREMKAYREVTERNRNPDGDEKPVQRSPYPAKRAPEAPPTASPPGTAIPQDAAPPTGSEEESFGEPAAGEESFGTPDAAAEEEAFGEPEAAPAEESFGDAAEGGEEAFDSADPGTVAEGQEAIELADPSATAWSENVGGWSEDQFMVSYRSTGHADPLIKAWIEALLGRVTDEPALAILRENLRFADGVKSTAAGNCLMCHTIDEERDAAGKVTGAIVNWHAQATTPYRMPERALTRFNHSAHLSLADCRHCHVTETEKDEEGRTRYPASFPSEGSWNARRGWFEKANPRVFHSNFRQLEKVTCAACHNGSTADDSCLHCHQYHFPAIAPK